MEDTRVLTLKALDEFIATQSALLAQTLDDIDRLRELKLGLLVDDDDHPPFSDTDSDDLDEWLKNRLDDHSFRLSERAEECKMKIPRDITCNWAVFEGCDPAPLHALTLQAQHAHAQRNIPPTTQTSPLSDLQLLVKSARKTIVDPVLALFADLSDDDEDEELTAEGEEAREREREREKIRELKRRKIRAWGGLSLPSSSSSFRGGGGGGEVKGEVEEGGVFIRRDVDDESMDVDIVNGEVNGCEMGMGMPPPPGPVLKNAGRSRKPSRKARLQVSSEEEEEEEKGERPRKKAKLPDLKSTPNAKGKADGKEKEKVNGKEKANGKERAKTKRKEKQPKPKPETYKQAWSVSEQHLLEQLLEQIPEGERFRWQKISRAMDGTRTPRQVASRVQKYFEKLKKFGVDGY